MPGPLDLRGRVTIVNGASGPLGVIKRDLASIGTMSGRAASGTTVLNNALVTGAAAARRFQGSMVASAAGAMGVLSALNKAEEFNKNVFGVGSAALADNTRRVAGQVVYDFERVEEVMRDVEKTSISMSKELGQSPTRISGIAEVLAKAGFDSEKIAAGTKAVAIAAITDEDTPVAQLGEFASVLDTIYKPRGNEKWGEFFARQLDVVRVAAGETRLSVGSMMEGLRPFSALYATLGNDEVTNSALLMAGVKKGGEATEVGHTLKSNMLRMLRSTAESNARFTALGLRRSDYTDLSAMDPVRASGNLSRAFRTADITGGFRKELEADMQRAIEGGTFDTAEFQDKLMAKVAKRAGVDMSDELSRSAFEEKFANSIFAGGARFNMLKLMQDLIAKNATAADLGTVFEGRRIGTNTQIIEGIKEHLDEYLGKLGLADGSGLAATQKIFDRSNFGALKRFQAMWEQFQISVANSGGLQMVLGGLTRVFEVLGSLPAPVTETAVALGVFAIALTPLAALIRGIATAASALAGARALIGLGAAGGSMMGLGAVGASAAAAGAATTSKMGRLLSTGMTAAGTVAANKVVGDAMIKGMGAGAAGSAAGGAGGGLLARFGIAGLLGWLGYAALGVENSIYASTDAKLREMIAKRDGIPVENVKMWQDYISPSSEAHASEARPAGDGLDNQGGMSALSEAQQAANEIRQAMSIDLSAEGRRAMETFAQGIAAGGAAAVQAASSIAARVRAAAQAPVSLNTGPNMQPAR